jgi:hypothetical protein
MTLINTVGIFQPNHRLSSHSNKSLILSMDNVLIGFLSTLGLSTSFHGFSLQIFKRLMKNRFQIAWSFLNLAMSDLQRETNQRLSKGSEIGSTRFNHESAAILLGSNWAKRA